MRLTLNLLVLFCTIVVAQNSFASEPDSVWINRIVNELEPLNKFAKEKVEKTLNIDICDNYIIESTVHCRYNGAIELEIFSSGQFLALLEPAYSDKKPGFISAVTEIYDDKGCVVAGLSDLQNYYVFTGYNNNKPVFYESFSETKPLFLIHILLTPSNLFFVVDENYHIYGYDSQEDTILPLKEFMEQNWSDFSEFLIMPEGYEVSLPAGKG